MNIYTRVMSKLNKLLDGRSERTQIVVKNAVGSFAVKCLSMAVDFAKVPVLLMYLDTELYGVYLTIASIIAWTHQFDFGLGAGLRYKLTEALAKQDDDRAKRLVSTAYLSMSVIMGGVLLICTPIIFLLDWNAIINTHLVGTMELTLCVLMVLAVFVVQFVLELISVVLQSEQRAAISSIFKPIANLLTLLAVFGLMLFSHNSLTLACLAMTLPIVVVLLIANVYFFKKKYNKIAPSFKEYDKHCLKDIYSLGIKYFVGSLSALIIFNTASFLISHYVNPTETAVYNTAWTYFGVIVMFNSMVIQPLVAAVTDAYTRNDDAWIKNIYKKINLYSLALTAGSLLMLAVSPWVFRLWVGDKVIVPWDLSIAMTVFFVVNIWNSPYTNFLSGVGKMNVFVISSCAKMVLFLPVAIFMLKTWGTVGMITSILLINSMPNLVLGRIQYKMVINHKAKGIWNK